MILFVYNNSCHWLIFSAHRRFSLSSFRGQAIEVQVEHPYASVQATEIARIKNWQLMPNKQFQSARRAYLHSFIPEPGDSYASYCTWKHIRRLFHSSITIIGVSTLVWLWLIQQITSNKCSDTDLLDLLTLSWSLLGSLFRTHRCLLTDRRF